MYKQNYTKGLWKLLLPIFIVGVIGFWFNREETIIIYAKQKPEIVTLTPSIPEFDSEVEEYIFEVFGEHYDKAMFLLKGKDGDCAENRTLNPYAVNDNTWWGGIGKDRGIFQINSVFHPLTDEQAFDYKQNIDYAFRMFKNDNYTFVRWTCGKYYGI